MIKDWFIAKKAEIKVKTVFYGSIAKILEDREDVVRMAQETYASFKGLTGDEIRDKILDRIAELAHAQAVKERESEFNTEE
jgi:hypothetical protein